MIADIYLQISILDNKIEVIRLGSKSTYDKKTYNFITSDSPITIGRHKSCKLVLDHDNTLSRINTLIYYHKGLDKWIVKDGHDGVPSTNGTWYYPLTPYEMLRDTSFRYGFANFLITLNKEPTPL
jgi:hypothetical protein